VDLDAVMTELGVALETVPNLRIAVVGEKPQPPAAYVSYPESITFDRTYGRGTDEMDLQVVLVVGQTVARATRAALAAFCAGSGASSVKSALEDYSPYESCDVVRVTSVDFDVVKLAAVDYMAAIFSVNVVGSGA
jgi:hypothetical protein